MTPRSRIVSSVIALTLPVVALGGCTQAGALVFGSADASHRHSASPLPSEWASAPAITYRYFPSAEVYFSDAREIYFWQNAFGEWEQGEHLPYFVQIDDIFAYESVALHVDDPTLFHDAFVRAFP